MNGENQKISSLQNPKIKEVAKMHKSKGREKSNSFIIEGIDELTMAIKANYTVNECFFDSTIISREILIDKIGHRNIILVEVSPEVYSKIAYRETSEGVIAVCKPKEHDINAIIHLPNALYLVIEAGEKPGNIGAILRTADASGVNAVLICDPQCDIYNPNTIRSSIGAVFSVPIVIGASVDIIHWLKNNNVNIVCTTPAAAIPYQTYNYNDAVAIVAGSESMGLTDLWLKNSSKNILIPMQGNVNSLNLSVSVAIVLYEAMRQRNFKVIR